MDRRKFLKNLTVAATISAMSSAKSQPNSISSSNRTFYLDGHTGNDEELGNDEKCAWRTINRLNKTIFKPGDRIYFKCGTDFPGQFKPQGSGTANQPIVIDSYGKGDLPHIHADGRAQASLYIHNVEYWTVRNIQISNKGNEPQGNRTGIYIHHENFGIAHNITLDNIHVHDVNGSLIKKQGGGSGILVNATGENYATSYYGLQITRCTIVDTQRNGIVFLSAGNRKTGLARDVSVNFNTIKRVPGDCILVTGCDGARIEHNTVSQCTLLPPGEAAAGIWPFNCDNTLIQFNEVSGHKAHADGEAFDSDLGCNRTLIQYNYSHDNLGGFALICNKGNVNLHAGNSGTIVRFNLSINDGLRVKGSSALHITGPVTNSKIYNNIFIFPKYKPRKETVKIFNFGDWQGTPSDIEISDNIIVSEAPPEIYYAADKKNFLKNNSTFIQSRPTGPRAEIYDTRESLAGGTREIPNIQLEKYENYRPSMSEAIQLIKNCFYKGKVKSNAYELIRNLPMENGHL